MKLVASFSIRQLVLPAAIALGSLALMTSPNASAKDKRLDSKALVAVVEQLTGTKVDSISKTPISGLHEVIVSGKVIYIDSTGKYVMYGHLIEAATQTSLTARSAQAFEKANTPVLAIEKLDLGDAIQAVNGRQVPGRVLVSFEDPRCGFCKKMHQTLRTIPDLVVYTFPLSFLGPQSRTMNENIWCSADRSKAWDEAMKSASPSIPSGKCDVTALDRNTALAGHFRVTGTPTLFTSDGTRIAGAVSAEAIEAALQAATSKRVNKSRSP